MAIEDYFEGNIGTGLAVGLGVAVLGPLLRPLVASVVRPAAKMAIRGGIYAYDRGREMVAELNEQASDMVAEARTATTHDAAASRPSGSPTGRSRASDTHPAATG
jgi:hypothetical protein